MIYQFNVALRSASPLIWRRFQVKEEASLKHLHQVLQIVMGWDDCHLHDFRISGKRYGLPDPEEEDTLIDERRVQLRKLISKPGQVLEYRYDYGDNWEHDVFLEAITEPHPRKFYPACLAGARTCPPEDMGGVCGYQTYLQALADRKHKDHGTVLAWRGRFDPEHFSSAIVNSLLKERFLARTQGPTRSEAPAPHAKWLTSSKERSDSKNIRVPLSARDAELLVVEALADEDLIARLRPGLEASVCQIACYEPGELDELLGCVASEANHSDKMQQKEWEVLYERMSEAVSG